LPGGKLPQPAARRHVHAEVKGQPRLSDFAAPRENEKPQGGIFSTANLSGSHSCAMSALPSTAPKVFGAAWLVFSFIGFAPFRIGSYGCVYLCENPLGGDVRPQRGLNVFVVLFMFSWYDACWKRSGGGERFTRFFKA
jgi:hypothetical protein